jgi:uncharacterized protein YhdP
MQRLLRWVAGFAGLAALLLALGIGAFRFALGMLPGYEARVVERVRESTGLTLEFDSVYGRIGRYGPEVVFRGARVLPSQGGEPLVTAAAGRVSLSIPRSIWYGRFEVARVALVHPRLSFVITSDGRLQLVGQAALLRPDEPSAPLTLDRLPRGRFAVTGATLDVLDLRARQQPERQRSDHLARARRGERRRSWRLVGDAAGKLPRAAGGKRLTERRRSRGRAQRHGPAPATATRGAAPSGPG